MKRTIFAAALALGLCLCASAKDNSLTFKKNGELKILQLTDLHFRPEMPQENAETFARIDYLVALERPDFIAVTGDVLWGKPAGKLLDSILERFDSYGIPYTIVYGNHDREQDLPEEKMSEIISNAANSVNPLGADGTLADVRIPVLASDGSGREMADIYMMDSQWHPQIKGIGKYGWFYPEQVEWLRDECEAATERRGANVPSLAFFHIPLLEYRRAVELNASKLYGIKGEGVASSEINTGMFSAMLSTGNVFGVFCGHDHDNDFIANYLGIALAYGRFSGSNTVYNNVPRGGRVIVLYEGRKEFRTWLREGDGRLQNEAVFNGEKVEEKRSMTRFAHVPEFNDDFYWENCLVCLRAYGPGMEKEVVSPGFDVWSKIPGRLLAEEWYAHMTAEGGDRIYYHHAPDGKDCYKVGKSLGAGTSLPMIDGKLQFPATNWREWRVVSKDYRKKVFELVYPEWEGDKGVKFSLVRRITVLASTYFCKVEDFYTVSAPQGKGAPVVKLAVGIRSADSLKGAPKKGWPRLLGNDRIAFWTAATDQSVEKEEAMLGTAVVVASPAPSRSCLTADKQNWVLEMPMPSDGCVTYWSGNCWSRGAITTGEEWFDLVNSFDAL